MQRRAAAIYAALFIVLAAGGYAMIGVAEEPTVSIRNPDHSLGVGDTVTIQGREYTFTEMDGGTAKLTWVEQEAEFTETWENGSTVTVDGVDFTVRTDPTGERPSFTLTEVQALDENVTTTEVDGVTYVVVEEAGERRLVPRDEYIRQQQGLPEVREFDQGDRVDYQGERTVASSVTNGSVTLTWTGSRNNTVRAQEGDVVDLNGREFVAHFPDGSTLELSTDVEAYRNQQETIDTYNERINGLWGVAILSSFAAITLIGLAYLPSRY